MTGDSERSFPRQVCTELMTATEATRLLEPADWPTLIDRISAPGPIHEIVEKTDESNRGVSAGPLVQAPSSALSGLSSTVCSWWWDDLDKAGAYRHYPPLAAFVADIPFTTSKLRDISAAASDKRIRVVGLQGEQAAFLWLFNPEATWWKLVVEKAVPAEITGVSVAISGLEPGTYRAQWWDTYEDKVLTEEKCPAAARSLTIQPPRSVRDIACQLTKLEAKH